MIVCPDKGNCYEEFAFPPGSQNNRGLCPGKVTPEGKTWEVTNVPKLGKRYDAVGPSGRLIELKRPSAIGARVKAGGMPRPKSRGRGAEDQAEDAGGAPRRASDARTAPRPP